jgi:hypothetical protein
LVDQTVDIEIYYKARADVITMIGLFHVTALTALASRSLALGTVHAGLCEVSAAK